jgi:hypothetical protein
MRSYSAVDGTTRDQVRELIGDFEAGRMFLENEYIDRVLAANSDDVSIAAAKCARSLYAALTRQVNRTVEGVTITRGVLADYLELLERLEADAGLSETTAIAQCFTGGTSRSDNKTIVDDTDFPPPRFGVGWDDRGGPNDT